MSDELDLSGAVDMIKDMLSGDEGKQQIQNILGMLGNQGANEQSGNNSGTSDTIEMMFKMQKVMSLMQNGCNAKHTAFLQTLRELLRPERRSAVDNAVKLLGVGSAIKAFKEIEGV